MSSKERKQKKAGAKKKAKAAERKQAKEKAKQAEKKKAKKKAAVKPSKAAKGTKGAAKNAPLDGRACPCCKKHCPLANPKCSKGKAVRAKALKEA